MSREVVTAPETRTFTADFRPGALLALLLLVVYGGVAVSVDFPRTAMGIQSDEATYYMMGHSLAEDGDLTYRRDDLVRVWKEFDSGPAGVFLKRGRGAGDPASWSIEVAGVKPASSCRDRRLPGSRRR